MVRIFKFYEESPSYSLKCIAGEMLNLEYGKRIWKCDKMVKDQKPYPRIKLDTCYIVPNINVGFLYVPKDLLNKFSVQIIPILSQMEKEMGNQLANKMFIQMSAYCSIEAPVRITRTFVTDKNVKTTHFEFQWVLLEFPYDIYNRYGNSSYISTIVYDRDNICTWEHDVVFFKQITRNDLMLLSDNTIIKLPELKLMEGLKYENIKVLSPTLAKETFIGHLKYIALVKFYTDHEGRYRMYSSTTYSLMRKNHAKLQHANILELNWDDVNKFNVYSPMAQLPSIDTRFGYRLSLDRRLNSCTVQVPDDKYDKKIRYNTCALCGLQLCDIIYGVPLERLINNYSIITRNTLDKKVSVDVFTNAGSEKLDNAISLMCTRCIYISYNVNRAYDGILFKIKHPMTLNEMLKKHKSKFGESLELIKSVSNAELLTFSDIHDCIIMNIGKDKVIYYQMVNERDIVRCFMAITATVKETENEGGKCTIYIQKI